MTTIAQSRLAAQVGPCLTEWVIGGVDTHRDTHTAAVLDATGRLLGHHEFPADGSGYRDLLAWLASWGRVRLVGVEGTGSYGSALAGYLSEHQVEVAEVDRPTSRTRRKIGKSDPIDAESAARVALARTSNATPKTHHGPVESLRVLRVARRSAVLQRADCTRRIKALIVTAPDHLRSQLRRHATTTMINACAALRPDRTTLQDPTQATKTALRHLARRHLALTDEIADLDALIGPLVAAINPAMLTLFGVGVEVAGQLLVTAGQNSHRIHSEAAFAMLCGAAPIPASSGQTHRHRLNRGGDRHANSALYTVAITRLRHHDPTIAYAKRRTTEGLTKKDIIRCLKRLIAREIYYTLNPTKPPQTPTLTNP